MAIAAGANLIFGPEMYIIESKLHMLSPHGRSQMWDDKADGHGRGEGVAAVMLKTPSGGSYIRTTWLRPSARIDQWHAEACGSGGGRLSTSFVAKQPPVLAYEVGG